MQTIGQDQNNQIKGLQTLLDDAHRREQNLRQDNSLADVLRTRRMLEDELNDERNACKHWHDTAQQNQGRIIDLLIQKFAFQLINQRKKSSNY